MSLDRTRSLSRRRFLVSSGMAVTAACLTPSNMFAQTESVVTAARGRAAKAKITAQTLRGNVVALKGSGGNIAVLSGRDGKLLVDAGYSASRPQISDALDSLSPDPTKHLVNTHWHFDHTDGNEWLRSVGATIIAHENTRKRLSTATHVDYWDFTFPPSPAAALPTEVFEKDRTLDINGSTILLTYYGPSHTDTDISAYFTEADVFHTGDTWWNGLYPFIDYSTGGNIDGMITAADSSLSKIGPKTIVVPGHGPVGDKSQLTEYRDMLAGIRDKVAALKKQGRTLDESVAAKPTAEYDGKWSGAAISPENFTRFVYAGV